jgi:beta-glucosidase
MGLVDIDELLAQLTVAEKASLTLGSDFWHTAPVDRLDVPAVMVSDGPHGLRAQPDQQDHVGLGGSLPATCFPTASALASSWDPEIFTEVGRALAAEALACGVSVVLGPGINIKRSPLCGRNFEYLSEDPWLAGVLATAMVDGVQSRGVGTSLKHFAANNQESDRLRVSAEVDERTLREIYLPAFEHVVTHAQPWTVMCAYNKVNGIYASEHDWLLNRVLRAEWGFAGLVVSDWGAVHDRVAALRAGLDLEMPPNLGRSDRAVVAAIGSGELSEEQLDRAARRVLELVEKSAGQQRADFDVAAHHALAREAARRSAVLLKNDGGLLPLRPQPGQTIALIGRFADHPRFQGAGSSQVNATRVDNAVDELTALVGPEVTVRSTDGAAVDDAAALARAADHVVVFLGLPETAESEGFDRTDLELPADQLELLAAVVAAQPRTAVVLTNGSVVRVTPWADSVPAVLETWLSGQAAGGAIADLLLGRANPSGKLAETIPLRLQDNPSYLNFPGDSGVVRYGEGIFVGYRAYDHAEQDVAYPFGYGLSYTSFALSDLVIDVAGHTATAAVTVTNTGEVAGAEVVQLYVRDVESTATRPVRELKAFARVPLQPGDSRRVTLALDERSFAFWSTVHSRWAVEAGEFEIALGTSSRHLPLRTTITLDAPSLAAPLGRMSTLHEWLADEQGQALLHHRFGDLGVLHDPPLLAVIGTMPMDTLAGFPGMGLDHDQLDELLAELGSAG